MTETSQDFPHLFSPLQLRGLTLPNRTVMPPMSTQLGSAAGLVTPAQIAFYRARAAGGTGMIIVEFCCVHRANGQSEPNQLALESLEHVGGHRELVQAIREFGTVACLQLQHGGAASKRSLLTVDAPWGPSDVPSRKDPLKLNTRAMTHDDIELIIECFGRSAELGVEAGYQAVELHGAHGYLLTQFLSPMFNHRTDAWGGDESRRLEFPRRVIARVRRAIGDRPLIYRLSAEEFSPLGLSIEDVERIAPRLVSFGSDALHVSIGLGTTSFDKVLEPMSTPEGWRLPYARRIRAATGVPVIAVGQIRQPATAERAVAEGDADLIALGRTLLADPEWANKARDGRHLDIIPCTSCNFCVANGMQERSIACADNPRTGRELDPLPRRHADQRAVVVGGGPAGMMAALMLDEAGFDTELREARQHLGGGLIASAAPPHKQMIDRYRVHLERRLASSNVRVLLGRPVDEAVLLSARPDVVMLANGASTAAPPVEGLDDPCVIDAYELLMGEGEALPPPGTDPVLVYGGGETGCETAEYLMERGHHVVLVTRSPLSQLARAAEMIYRGTLLARLAKNPALRMLGQTTLTRVIAGGSAVLQAADGQQTVSKVHRLIIAQGRRSDPALPEALSAAGIRCFTLGDARRGGRIGDAVRDAYEAVHTLCA